MTTFRTSTKTSIAVVLGLAVVLSFGALALAQPGPRGHGMGGHGRMGPMGGPMGGGPFLFRGLDLSDEQREQIRAIHQDQRAAARPLLEQLAETRQALRSVVLAEPLDEVQLQARAEELAAIQTELAVQQARTHAAVLQVLTPEQREQATTMQAERHERRLERQPRWQERRLERRSGN